VRHSEPRTTVAQPGREAYRDESFDRPPVELLGEIAKELADVAGWAFIAWARVHELAQKQ
jgi:hypothetical protein